MTLTPLSTPREIRNEARRNSLHLVEIDLTGCRDKKSAMQRLSDTLSLPASFGRNWDALLDVLRDLQVDNNEQNLILMVLGADLLRRNTPEDYEILRTILEEWSAEYGPNKVTTYLFDSCG